MTDTLIILGMVVVAILMAKVAYHVGVNDGITLATRDFNDDLRSGRLDIDMLRTWGWRPGRSGSDSDE